MRASFGKQAQQGSPETCHVATVLGSPSPQAPPGRAVVAPSTSSLQQGSPETGPRDALEGHQDPTGRRETSLHSRGIAGDSQTRPPSRRILSEITARRRALLPARIMFPYAGFSEHTRYLERTCGYPVEPQAGLSAGYATLEQKRLFGVSDPEGEPVAYPAAEGPAPPALASELSVSDVTSVVFPSGLGAPPSPFPNTPQSAQSCALSGQALAPIQNAGGLRMDRVDTLLTEEERSVVGIISDNRTFLGRLRGQEPVAVSPGPPSKRLPNGVPANLVSWGVWEKVRRAVLPFFVFLFFFVPKADGSARLVGDASALNKAMRRPPTFCLPGLFDVLLLVANSRFLVDFDFRNWFYQIPVVGCLRRFFGARVGARHFFTRVLLMGWSYAPLIAQTISRAIVRKVLGVWGLVYIDNILVGAQSREHMARLLDRLKTLLTWL